MAKSAEKQTLKPAELIRNGWLAYLGVYGAAFERLQDVRSSVENMTETTTDVLEDLIAKGEVVEHTAQDRFSNVRERATNVYTNRFARFSRFMPSGFAANDRVAELEAEVKNLNRKIATLNKKPATKKTAKRTTKSRAKAA